MGVGGAGGRARPGWAAGVDGVGGLLCKPQSLFSPAWLVVKPDTSTLGLDSRGCCLSPCPSWIFWIFENPVAQEEEEEGGRNRSAEECERSQKKLGARAAWVSGTVVSE